MLPHSMVRKLEGFMVIAVFLVAFVACEGSFRRRTSTGISTASSSPANSDKAVCNGKDIFGYLTSDGKFWLKATNSSSADGSCACGPNTAQNGAPLLRCPDYPSNFPVTDGTSYECSQNSNCPAQL
ncbi:secreted protein [Melampsora americana]|nr:secreted protein [Melampsora americana]